MDEPEFDPRLVTWLREGPAGASGWVLDSVVHHARRHPRRLAAATGWIDLLRGGASRDASRPTLRLALLLGVTALLVALAALAYVGSRSVVPAIPTASPTPAASPVPTLAPTLVPRPSWSTPEAAGKVIDDALDAWRLGTTSAVPELFAPEHWLRVIGDTTGLETNHFEIRPGGRGYVYWERRGAVFGDGAFWTHPMVAGVWDPGLYGFAVYRLGDDGRIQVEWILIRPTTWTSWHESVDGETIPSEVAAFLEGCARAFATGDGLAFLACYEADAGVYLSAGSPDGRWTAESHGAAAIANLLDVVTPYADLTPVGDAVMVGSLVASPFRGPSNACRAGIDIFELNGAHIEIRNRWTFCGP